MSTQLSRSDHFGIWLFLAACAMAALSLLPLPETILP